LNRRRQFSPWWKRPFIGLGEFHKNMLALEAQTLNPMNTRHIIVNSEMVRREIIEHHNFPEERIHLIRNGIDIEKVGRGNRSEARAAFGIRDNEFVVAFVGSGWERKGLHFLMNGLRRVMKFEPIRLLVVGKGTRPWGAPRGAIFTGPLSEVETAYAAADLFATLPMYEPSANVVAEALAVGLPVVTSAQNGAAELLKPGVTGTVVDNPANNRAVERAVLEWFERRDEPRALPPDLDFLGIDRNVDETLNLLLRLGNV
jgi:UDP-glucose:(heptosyl)LPS alpha-1,3-glucosyltransferase